MRADVPGVTPQVRGAFVLPHAVAGGVEIRVHRGLGVHDHRFARRQAHEHIRAQTRTLVVGRAGLLFGEVAVVEHPGEFDDAAELDFAPAPAHVGAAQGVDEVVGFAAQEVLNLQQRTDLRGKPLVGTGAGAFEFGDVLAHLVEGCAHGADEGVDGLLAAFEIARGGFVETAKVGFGEGEEAGLVGAQGIGGQRAEGVGEFGAGVVEQAELVRVGVALGTEEGVEFGGAGAQVGVFEAHVEEGGFEFGQAGGAGFGGGAGGGFDTEEVGVFGGEVGAQAGGEEVASLPQPEPAEEAEEREYPRAQPETEEKIRGGEVHERTGGVFLPAAGDPQTTRIFAKLGRGDK